MPRALSMPLLLATWLLSGCVVGDVLGGGDRSELQENREKWVTAGITSYTYRLDRSCFCLFFGPADVTVANDVIVAVRLYVPDTVDLAQTDFAIFHSIEGLFDVVAEAIDGGAHKLDVTYDGKLGFPSHISIDYIENAIDDELMLEASQVVPVQP